jgi:translation initiation factor 1 (eIF-1/SUI1)
MTTDHIVTMNRYTPLYNLQANNAEPNGLQALQGQRKQTEQTSKQNMNKTTKQHRKGMKILTIINGRLLRGDDWKPTTKKKKETTSTPGTSTSHKVKILGDSHLRGPASKIDHYLNTSSKSAAGSSPEQTQKN